MRRKKIIKETKIKEKRIYDKKKIKKTKIKGKKIYEEKKNQ